MEEVLLLLVPYLSFVPFEAISPSAVHHLNAVERSQDEQGSRYPHPYRHQHPGHIASLQGEGNHIRTLHRPQPWVPHFYWMAAGF